MALSAVAPIVQQAAAQPQPAQVTVALDGGVVRALAWSADGSKFAAALADDGPSVIHILDAKSHQVLTSLAGHEKPVVGIAFDDRATFLWSADTSGSVRKWDLKKGQMAESMNMNETCYSMGAGGTAVLVGVRGRVVHIDGKRMKVAATFQVPRSFGRGEPDVRQIAVDAKGTVAIVSTGDLCVPWRCDLKRGEAAELSLSCGGAVAITPDGKRMVTVGAKDDMLAFDARTGSKLADSGFPPAFTGEVVSMHLGGDVAGLRYKASVVIVRNNGDLVWCWGLDPSDRELLSVAVSPDGKTVLMGTLKTLRIGDTTAFPGGRRLTTGRCEWPVVLPGGKMLTTLSTGRFTTQQGDVVNLENGKVEQTVDGMLDQARRLGEYITCRSYKTDDFQVYDLKLRLLRSAKVPRTSKFMPLALGPGARVAVCWGSRSYQEKEVCHAVDLTTNRELWALADLKFIPRAVVFSGDGTRLLVQTESEALILDASNGQQLLKAVSETSKVFSHRVEGDVVELIGAAHYQVIYKEPFSELQGAGLKLLTVNLVTGAATSRYLGCQGLDVVDATADGKLALVRALGNGRSYAVSVESGETVLHIPHPPNAGNITLDPEGRYVVGHSGRFCWSVPK
ncbi:MAG: WD40 repeat domain-containing protein [Planctomycetota bacterium]